MKKWMVMAAVCCLTLGCTARTQEVDASLLSPRDSAWVASVMRDMRKVSQPSLVQVATYFTGVPYVAGTLDEELREHLVVRCDAVDCTTFVELAVALWRTVQSEDACPEDFAREVERMRYREGVVKGYVSRLHYFSDWVAVNARRGVWTEMGPEQQPSPLWRADTLRLGFMSEHPTSYNYLKYCPAAADTLRVLEQEYTGRVCYELPKTVLNRGPEELPVCTGDILGLVTTIDGLDVTHLGLAVWREKKLHLMHASMKHGQVVVDERTLYDYLLPRKKTTGIRVIRLNRLR